MFSRSIIVIFFALLLAAITACSTEGCYQETESDLYISLKESDNEDPGSTDSLTVYGYGILADSLYKNATASFLLLPLDPSAGNSAFVFINGGVSDTVTVNYDSRSNFVSKGCGYNFLYTIESVSFTKNRIDTILIINNSVTPEDEENLRAFF